MKKIILLLFVGFALLLSGNAYAQCDGFGLEFNETCIGETTAEVVIRIVGGTAPYSIGGTFNDGAYPDDTFAFSVEDSDEYDIEVVDANGCSAVLAGATFCSKCFNEAGTVTEVSTGSVELQTICSGESITVNALGAFVDSNNPEDPNSTLIYALHTSATDVAGDILLIVATGSLEETIEDGTISYEDAIAAGAIPGVTYYISSVVGPDSNENGIPDVLGDECTLVAPGLAVVFTEGFDVSINVDVDCDMSTGIATITASVSGGGEGTTYEVSGIFSGLVSEGEEFSIEDVPNGTWSLTANAIGGGSCVTPASVQDVIECDKNAVEWLNFEGEVTELGNLLSWTTANEVNNEHFAIERSSNGIDFEVIAVEEGAGNSQIVLNYQFLDRSAPSGISYYKVVQYDFDGQNTTTNVIALTRGERSFSIDGIMPVPAVSYVELSFTAIATQNIDLTLYDLTGRKMLNTTLDANEGGNNFVIDVTTVPNGIYLLSLNDGTKVVTTKLLVD